MAVKMRLMRMGKTKSPHYRVVVIDGRAPRDGRYIDQIGRYDPREDPSLIEIDADKAVGWLEKGAQPTETVRKLLEVSGTLTKFKVTAGQIHTVGGDDAAEAGAPEAPEEPQAEELQPEPSTASPEETAVPGDAEDAGTAESDEEATVASEEE